MIKNKKRLCAGILAVVMAFTGCAGSTGSAGSNGSDGSTTGISEPTNPVEISETHKLTNTLHKVTVTESERQFVVEGKSEYKIIAGEDDATQKAAYYLQLYIEKATGCKLEFATTADYKADGKFIVLNVSELFDSAGLTMPEDELGVQGYYIKSVGDNVFLNSNYENGARFAMLAFLRNVLGFKMYSLEAVSFEKDGATLPDMEIVEKPDISYYHRMHNNPSDEPEETYMMGFITYDAFISIDGNYWHNSLSYLPMETYQEAHPNWYSTEGNELCYTGHGDENEVDAMTTIIADRMIEEIGNNPDVLFAACTIGDHASVCACEACTASREKYNGADSASIIKFTNKINEKVQAELQRQADEKGTKKRPITVMFFAYHAETQPPAVKNEDGTYSPIDDSVVCDEDVAVFYAPIAAEYNYTFYESNNDSFRDMMEGWTACADNILCWLYETNFMYYMYPYNSWDSMMETYRYCVDTGAIYIMGQDQHNAQASTAFTDLKDYINSCALLDLNQDYNDILDDYFTNYYLDAAEPMRQYFDELRAHMRYLESEYPAELNGSIYAEIAEAKFWPQKTLEHWLALIDEAYEAVEVYKDQKVLYENLIERITKESMFMRYVLIEHYSGMFSEDVLNDMKLSFKEDAQLVGLSRYQEGEGGELANLYETWGIK